MPTASPLCLTVFHLEEILGFTLKMTADTLQTLTKLEAERSRKIRRIMNKFPSHPHAQDILFTTQFFGSLYPVNEISNTCEGAAFKLLFSLEAWHWKKKKEGFHQMTEELLLDPFRSENRAMLGNAISHCHQWDCLSLSHF